VPTALPSSTPSISSQPTSAPTFWYTLVNVLDLDGLVLQVMSVIDAPVDAGACAPLVLPAVTSSSFDNNCTLRSAIEYCCTLSTNESCSVVLPDQAYVELHLGEIVVTSSNDLTIYGQGSTIFSAGSSSRFMTLAASCNMSIVDIQLQGFGGDHGGALLVSEVSGAMFQRVRFLNNSGIDGGAVYINSSDHIMFTDCMYKENFASSDGGALYVSQNNDYITLSSSELKFNGASSSGGGIFVHQNNQFLTLLRLFVHDNVAADSGGGLFVGDYNNHFQLRDSTLADCSAGAAGGGVSLGSQNINFLVESSEILRCTAKSNGGGFYSYSNDALSLVNTVISNCFAVMDGGGLYLSSGSINNVVSGSSVLSCVAGNDGKFLPPSMQFSIIVAFVACLGCV
jgi:hypothetical protein